MTHRLFLDGESLTGKRKVKLNPFVYDGVCASSVIHTKSLNVEQQPVSCEMSPDFIPMTSLENFDDVCSSKKPNLLCSTFLLNKPECDISANSLHNKAEVHSDPKSPEGASDNHRTSVSGDLPLPLHALTPLKQEPLICERIIHEADFIVAEEADKSNRENEASLSVDKKTVSASSIQPEISFKVGTLMPEADKQCGVSLPFQNGAIDDERRVVSTEESKENLEGHSLKESKDFLHGCSRDGYEIWKRYRNKKNTQDACSSEEDIFATDSKLDNGVEIRDKSSVLIKKEENVTEKSLNFCLNLGNLEGHSLNETNNTLHQCPKERYKLWKQYRKTPNIQDNNSSEDSFAYVSKLDYESEGLAKSPALIKVEESVAEKSLDYCSDIGNLKEHSKNEPKDTARGCSEDRYKIWKKERNTQNTQDSDLSVEDTFSNVFKLDDGSEVPTKPSPLIRMEENVTEQKEIDSGIVNATIPRKDNDSDLSSYTSGKTEAYPEGNSASKVDKDDEPEVLVSNPLSLQKNRNSHSRRCFEEDEVLQEVGTISKPTSTSQILSAEEKGFWGGKDGNNAISSLSEKFIPRGVEQRKKSDARIKGIGIKHNKKHRLPKQSGGLSRKIWRFHEWKVPSMQPVVSLDKNKVKKYLEKQARRMKGLTIRLTKSQRAAFCASAVSSKARYMATVKETSQYSEDERRGTNLEDEQHDTSAKMQGKKHRYKYGLQNCGTGARKSVSDSTVVAQKAGNSRPIDKGINEPKRSDKNSEKSLRDQSDKSGKVKVSESSDSTNKKDTQKDAWSLIWENLDNARQSKLKQEKNKSRAPTKEKDGKTSIKLQSTLVQKNQTKNFVRDNPSRVSIDTNMGNAKVGVKHELSWCSSSIPGLPLSYKIPTKKDPSHSEGRAPKVTPDPNKHVTTTPKPTTLLGRAGALINKKQNTIPEALVPTKVVETPRPPADKSKEEPNLKKKSPEPSHESQDSSRPVGKENSNKNDRSSLIPALDNTSQASQSVDTCVHNAKTSLLLPSTSMQRSTEAQRADVTSSQKPSSLSNAPKAQVILVISTIVSSEYLLSNLELECLCILHFVTSFPT